MTPAEIKKLNPDQLKTKLREGRDELFAMRQKNVTEKVADISSFKKKRKDIARTLTEMNARRHAATPKKAAPVAAAPASKKSAK
jgi:ribosomal protein L29